jgi:(1->4)-alpha-D-glucan 1-alpha-D-glucosylmutase
VERIAPAGVINALSQTLLRLTSPGVPDLYQGTEYWDFSLVDPDNRRKVDFPAREASLRANLTPAALLPEWRDGRVKQAVIARALRLRAASPGLFTQGAYTPLKIEGPRAEHVIGFLRVHEGRAAITLATRLPTRMEGVEEMPLPSPSFWRGTVAVLSRNLLGRRIFDVLRCQNGGDGGAVLTGSLAIGEALAALPVALLEVR